MGVRHANRRRQDGPEDALNNGNDVWLPWRRASVNWFSRAREQSHASWRGPAYWSRPPLADTCRNDPRGRHHWQVLPAHHQYASSRSSAEWVVEAPTARWGRLLPLDTFGWVGFSQASTVKDGERVTIAQAGVAQSR